MVRKEVVFVNLISSKVFFRNTKRKKYEKPSSCQQPTIKLISWRTEQLKEFLILHKAFNRLTQARRKLKRHRSNSSTSTRNILVISSTISICIHIRGEQMSAALLYTWVVNSELETIARLSCIAKLCVTRSASRVEVMISISVVGWTTALWCAHQTRCNIHVRLADLASNGTVTWITYVKPSVRSTCTSFLFPARNTKGTI